MNEPVGIKQKAMLISRPLSLPRQICVRFCFVIAHISKVVRQKKPAWAFRFSDRFRPHAGYHRFRPGRNRALEAALSGNLFPAVLRTRQARKPLFLLRMSAVFPLRYAARHLLAVLFHEPPRNTRFLRLPIFCKPAHSPPPVEMAKIVVVRSANQTL